MPLPCSGSQVNQLGRRLKRSYPRTSAADDELFGQVLSAYDGVLNEVTAKLSALGLLAVPRLKTITTLVDKLRRESIKLSEIRDLAGARIVLSPKDWRREQDTVVGRIVDEFANCPKPPRLIDRRAEPNHGYRAVHVIVYPGGLPVEIQVRTVLQDVWAQAFEKFGDDWGRGIRYGQAVDNPEAPAFPRRPDSPSRRRMLDGMMSLSETLDRVEVAWADLQLTEDALEQAVAAGAAGTESDPRVDEIETERSMAERRLADSMQETTSLVSELFGV